MKYCPKCKNTKKEIEFYRDKSMKDGLYVYCRKCARRYDKKRYPLEKEARKESAKKWRKKNKKRFNKLTREWRKRNPRKVKKSQHKFRLSPKSIFIQLKYRGAKFSQKDFLEWYDKQEKRCFYCGILENVLLQHKKFLLQAIIGKLTIDKKDSDKGYVLNNIILSCMRCNLIKSNFFSSREMKQLAKQFITPKWQK